MHKQITDLEYDAIKSRKHYEKSKKYSKELEQNIVHMDEKLRKLQQKHKSQALASQLEEGEDLATALNCDPFETELNEIRGMTQSILDAQSPPKHDDEQSSRITPARGGSLVHLENMIEQQIGDDEVIQEQYHHFSNSIME